MEVEECGSHLKKLGPSPANFNMRSCTLHPLPFLSLATTWLIVQSAITMLVELDLGDLDLESKTSGLQLHLSSSAKFAASAEDELDELKKRLTDRQTSPDSSCQPWISRGNSFRLVLLLQTESGITALDQDALVETLAAQLQAAKVSLRSSVCLAAHTDT